MTHFEGDVHAPAAARFAILASRWNPRIVDALVAAAREAFASHGVAAERIDVIRVPGAWELPQAAARIASRYAGVVALGCVVRGETRHYEHVADECAKGLMRVALDSGVPVANGVLAVEAHADAEARAGGAHGNKGEECALAILEMANLYARIGAPATLRPPAGHGTEAAAASTFRRAPDRNVPKPLPVGGGYK